MKHLEQYGRKRSLFAANELLVVSDSFKWMSNCQEVRKHDLTHVDSFSSNKLNVFCFDLFMAQSLDVNSKTSKCSGFFSAVFQDISDIPRRLQRLFSLLKFN
jgi:hypothetical protein